jgi:hypothetical protein
LGGVDRYGDGSHECHGALQQLLSALWQDHVAGTVSCAGRRGVHALLTLGGGDTVSYSLALSAIA